MTRQQLAPLSQDAEAERLSQLTDCPDRERGGRHCDHYQEGDGACCRCDRPNWCPDGMDAIRPAGMES